MDKLPTEILFVKPEPEASSPSRRSTLLLVLNVSASFCLADGFSVVISVTSDERTLMTADGRSLMTADGRSLVTADWRKTASKISSLQNIKSKLRSFNFVRIKSRLRFLGVRFNLCQLLCNVVATESTSDFWFVTLINLIRWIQEWILNIFNFGFGLSARNVLQSSFNGYFWNQCWKNSGWNS